MRATFSLIFRAFNSSYKKKGNPLDVSDVDVDFDFDAGTSVDAIGDVTRAAAEAEAKPELTTAELAEKAMGESRYRVLFSVEAAVLF